MGKKQRAKEKREAKKEKEQLESEEELKRIAHRRSFVTKSLAIAGVLAGGGGVASYFLSDKDSNLSFIHRRHDFENYVLPEEDFYDCVQIGEKASTTDEEVEIARSKLTPEIVENLRNQGLEADSVDVSKYLFGKPHTGKAIDDAMIYSKELLEYLRTRINGLDTEGISFHKLVKGKHENRNYNRKVFFGDYFVSQLKAEVKDGDRIIMDPFILQLEAGAMTAVNEDSTIYFSFIPSTQIALLGIPSEIIPYTTMPKSIEYMNEVGPSEGLKADETIAEGISQIVSLEFGKSKGVPNIERFFDKLLANTITSDPKYALVPDSIRWLQSNGVQQGLDLYMDDPQKYMDAIVK